MMKLSERLKDTLQTLLDKHDELLVLQQKKKQVLVEGNVDLLFSILADERNMVREIEKLEECRLQEIWKLFPHEFLSVSDIIPLLTDEKEQMEMKEFQQRLRNKIEELQHIHQLNKQLIEQSLAYTTYSLQLLTKRKETTFTYTKENRVTEKELGYSERFFDTKA
jgi:flagellar biosynthesis/type III secretory pathway chaperone